MKTQKQKKITIKGVKFNCLYGRRAEDYIYRYNQSWFYSLDDAYKTTYSVFKARAEKEIKEEVTKIGGVGYKVIGAGNMFFSCGYKLYIKMLGTTKAFLVVHTPDYRYIIDINNPYSGVNLQYKVVSNEQ